MTTRKHLSFYFLLATLAQIISADNKLLNRNIWHRRQDGGGDELSGPPSNINEAAAQVASVLALQSQALTSAAVPLPTDLPEDERALYEHLASAVNAGPVLQNAVEVDDITEQVGKMIAELSSPDSSTNSSDALEKRQSGLRVMIVGDSMSHGAEGDFTWRYRIWEWFRSQNVAVSFVGPYKGTQPPNPPNPDPPPPLYGQNTIQDSSPRLGGGYAPGVASEFAQSGHFAAWGRPAALDRFLIADTLKGNPADLILLMLGFNDMGWFYSGPTGTLQSVKAIIDNARSVNPNIKFAVANVPQRTSLGRKDLPTNTDTYNGYLAQAIPKWTTTTSPIGLVKLRENYQCELGGCPAGYDGLHPNELGDYQIAQAFSRTLVDVLKIGKNYLTFSTPAKQVPALPANFRVQSSPRGVTVTWDKSYGAYSYDTRVRIPGGAWSEGYVNTNRIDQHWSISGFTYEYQIRATRGTGVTSDWTGVGSAVAQPQQAAPPNNIKTTATSTGMDLTWDASAGPYSDSIVEYNVILWDRGGSDCNYIWGAAFKGTSAHIDGLQPNHRYLVWVSAWNANGEGFPGGAYGVVPGQGTPGAPTGLNIITTDPTSIYYTWDNNPAAGGYLIWHRNFNNNGSLEMYNGSRTETCSTDYFMYPGAWNYEYCIQAHNGNSLSPIGPCVKAPQPNGDANKGLTCPAPKAWCAGGATAWGPDPETPVADPGSGGGNAGGGTGNTGGSGGSNSTNPQPVQGGCTLEPVSGRYKLPTVDEIIQRYMGRLPFPNQDCVFYVGPFKDDAIRYTATRKEAVTLYDVYFKDNEPCTPFGRQNGPATQLAGSGQLREWFQITSRAYARVCFGTAIFVWDTKFPLEDPNGQWTSIWLSDEFDEIQYGDSNINYVVRLDPATGGAFPYWRRPSPQIRSEPESTVDLDRYSLVNDTVVKEIIALPTRKHLAERQTAPTTWNVEGSVFAPGQRLPYTPGRCSFHIAQYAYPDNNFAFDLTLYDDKQENIVGGLDYLKVERRHGFTLQSRLHHPLNMLSGYDARDPLTFEFDGFNFNSSSSVCKFGGYDKGKRQGDCSFACFP